MIFKIGNLTWSLLLLSLEVPSTSHSLKSSDHCQCRCCKAAIMRLFGNFLFPFICKEVLCGHLHFTNLLKWSSSFLSFSSLLFFSCINHQLMLVSKFAYIEMPSPLSGHFWTNINQQRSFSLFTQCQLLILIEALVLVATLAFPVRCILWLKYCFLSESWITNYHVFFNY